MNKLVIFGGSFDPVTKAHEAMARELAHRFDKVVVVPCKRSPFKSGATASGKERLDMLRIAMGGEEKIEISTFELDSEGVDYTYKTLEHFAPCGELYLAVGSEMVIELEKWARIDVIRELATLYVVPRPSYPLGSGEIEKLTALFGDKYVIADFTGEEGSSSEVKITFAMDEPERFLSRDVAQYATVHGLYGEYKYVRDIYARFHLKERRVLHSFSTALTGVRLAKRAKVDTGKATTALLLHDIGKYLTKEDAEKMGVKFDGKIDGMPLLVRHAEIGAEILRQILKIEDEDVIEAVRWHTTGKPNMSPIEKVVYLADYIEPMRDFPNVGRLREETEKSIDDGLYVALENSVKYVGEEEIYPVTVEAYEYYKKELKK